MSELDDPAVESRHLAPNPAIAENVSAAVYATTQEALSRCRRYRKENGLYGVVEPALGRIMLEIGAVGAVTVPTALGNHVRERLRTASDTTDRGRSGPIVGHPRSGRWTFLTGHADDSTQDVAELAALFHQSAALALPGTRIVLPSPADERTGYRVWIDSPDGTFRPELAEVIAVIHGCRSI